MDEEQIYESTYNTSNKWGHQGHPEPVVVTPGEQKERSSDDSLLKAALFNIFYNDTECVMRKGLLTNPQKVIAQLCSSTDLFLPLLAQWFGFMA